MENFNFIFLILSFFFGSILGSFLNVVILRLPLEQKLTGRSHCTNCKHVLSTLDLFPLFSFIFLLGKCRHCGHKISPRYFLVEFLTGLLFAFSWWLIGPTQLFEFILLTKYFVVIAILICVFIIDLEHYLILDSIIFSGLGIVIFLNLFLDISKHLVIISLSGNFISGLLAALLAVVPFFSIWYFSKGKWMGFGDVKLSLFLGVALGLKGVFMGMLLGIVLGGGISVFLLIFTAKNLKSHLPFGTFLSLGAMVSLFYGDKILRWYLSFLGF